ncbi:SDR family oxidoreductase [Fundidesulfovibrio terrae]|uniref:SDR family oxidoreductase n=1 Tax=Fundidesulfovibrio terrae TaxID=2922866 RepID=UPI001FAF73F3
MYEQAASSLQSSSCKWVVTGAAGFIGSNLVERLLSLGQTVTALDSFATGHRSNLESVRASVGEDAWKRFTFIEGDIQDPAACRDACAGADYVLHQAALGSVPRSLADPVTTNAVNVGGFVTMLTAAKGAGVKRFVYASSSSVYGDHPALPKVEDTIGNQLSPYAVSKNANELYARVFAACYKLEVAGLRYFNIFGPRQDPNGAYAAVIPKWFASLLNGEPVFINGDGETSRDFCFVENAVRANLLAALSQHPEASGKAYNVACGQRTTLNELYGFIRDLVARRRPEAAKAQPTYREERPGDVRHSLANISRAETLLGYKPAVMIGEGLERAADWYFATAAK